MPSPSARKPKWYKSDFHGGKIGCALFAVIEDESKARNVGENKYMEGDRRKLSSHAEQRWWDEARNRRALATLATREDLVRCEFEVTNDLCSDCRDRFAAEVRRYVPKGVAVLVFIMREKTCIEVNDRGELGDLTRWG